ncbi:transposase [Flagellimonas algicola]|uniref:Transposase n=1 Tax=Flagellimonas algicola TaxID=2583815 RepID=A0ABY2WGS2_9FLAO|nr:transposase [Allomuricauda algicola]TMU50769.1 hypothetical protein FGG15_18400 [Allomuricauda algicola]
MARPKKRTAQAVVKNIKRQTRRRFNSEEKIRIVLEGLKGEESIAAICRRESISPIDIYRIGFNQILNFQVSFETGEKAEFHFE